VAVSDPHPEPFPSFIFEPLPLHVYILRCSRFTRCRLVFNFYRLKVCVALERLAIKYPHSLFFEWWRVGINGPKGSRLPRALCGYRRISPLWELVRSGTHGRVTKILYRGQSFRLWPCASELTLNLGLYPYTPMIQTRSFQIDFHSS
jgi:hypothetical protein